MNLIINFLLNHTPLFYWTQSLWRDEAFSVWIAEAGVMEVIRRTSGDFNPPLYYILLYFWMNTIGRSEIALRGLSILFFILTLLVVYKFAYVVFQKTVAARITVLLMALNPMLLYFAFELRMYSLLCFLVTLSMYFFYTRNWRCYIIATTLGMYTQPFMILAVIAQMCFLLLKKEIKQIFVTCTILFVLYLPWITTLITQFKTSGPMWMYPVSLTTFASVLGNVFVGYEGTPGNLWILMTILSLILILITFKLVGSNTPKQSLLLVLLWVYLPLIFVLSISLVKPIYVHRYVIYTTIGEVFLLSMFVNNINNNTLKKKVIFGITVLLLAVNIGAVSFHRKVNIRATFDQLPFILKNSDSIYAGTPLVFYETLYYRPGNTAVYLYNPEWQTPPRYVGSIGMPEKLWAKTFPVYPKRAIVIHEDGTFTVSTAMGRNKE